MHVAAEPWVDYRRKAVEVRIEKRHFPRLEFHCQARIHGIKGRLGITDISMGGIFIELEDHSTLRKGQTVYLCISLPTERDPIKVKARVANLNGRGIGVRFINLNRRNQNSIRFCFNTFKDTLPIR
jgi:c-di-GMP-binding flagellar brake protein YcgR